jgi:hypothetical protein
MLIAILNQASQSLQPTVTNADAAAMTAAIASQIQSDVAPIWGRAPATVTFYTDSTVVPPGAYVITIVDNIPDQQPGVVGSHTESQAGQMSGLVAAQPDLTHGGQVLTGDWSVSCTLSHEVLEMFIDPNCNLWANDGQGSVYGLEVCDPVEAPHYTVNVGGQDVAVSNFVTPAWFDPLAPSGAQVDFQGWLKTGAFTTLPGGYMTYESKSGKLQQQFGTAYPAWRQVMKCGNPEGRGQQRLVQLGAMYHS